MYLYTWLGIQHSIMYEYNTLCYTMISEGCGTLLVGFELVMLQAPLCANQIKNIHCSFLATCCSALNQCCSSVSGYSTIRPEQNEFCNYFTKICINWDNKLLSNLDLGQDLHF